VLTSIPSTSDRSTQFELKDELLCVPVQTVDLVAGGSSAFSANSSGIVLAKGGDEDGLDGVKAVFGLVEHDAGF
jgi:hypothetical protein